MARPVVHPPIHRCDGTVIEQSTEPDYALLRLEQLPAVDPTLMTTGFERPVAIIQYPRRGLKGSALAT